MIDVGLGEMALILAIALVAIGPKQLPEVARTVGKFVAEFRKMLGGVSDTLADTQKQANGMLGDWEKELLNPEPRADAKPRVQAPATAETSKPEASSASTTATSPTTTVSHLEKGE